MIGPYLLFTHFLAFLPFLLLLHATPSPAPDPYPAVVSLPAVNSRTPSARFTATQPQTTPEIEHDLLPFVIISTIDGSLHAVDRDTGKVKWTLRDGVEPLVGGGVKGKGNNEEYIVEPLSGSLFVFEEDNENEYEKEGVPKVRKLPLSVEQLIELSPFTFPHSPSRIFTGSKHTSLLTIDLRTGQQISCFSSLANISSSDDDCMCESDDTLDDLEARGRSNRDVLFVGRTDYRLTIHSPSLPGSASSAIGLSGPTTDGESKRGKSVQEIVYSTYTPNTYDKPLAEYWTKVGASQSAWEDDGSEMKRLRVELSYDGVAVGVEENGSVRWVETLDSVGIAVYDVLLPLMPTSANPILVPQPPPHLPSLFPLSNQAPQFDIQAKAPSTYIGSVPFALSLTPSDDINASSVIAPPYTSESSGGRAQDRETSGVKGRKPLLYALSSSSYPLINFAPPPRPGTLANGSFQLSEDMPDRDQLLPYLLDPPEDETTPPTIDEGDRKQNGETSSIRRKAAGKNWIWWVLGVLASIVICGAAFAGFHRRNAVRQSTTPPDEKTPLLVQSDKEKEGQDREKERTITFVEPPISPPTIGEPSVTADEETTPKKKTTRRRVRGKKKRRDSNATQLDKEGEEDDDDSGEKDGSASSTPPSVSKKDDKPLPELPREISSTALADVEDKERLAISDTIIGFGSHGTVVLKGTWGGRPVAVKRLLSDFTRLASQEVKLLQASDDHPNVIRYYCQERRDNFLYIALDLCQASLADLIEAPDKHLELASVLDRKKALTQVTAGLMHLHGMKIIHRDIKPQNVLVSQAKDGSLRMLVSDFGLARRLEQDQSSFAPTANNLAGSLGWRAPECIRGQVRLNDLFDRASSSCSSSSGSSSSLLDLITIEADEKDAGTKKVYARLTKAVDLFALGCLYFWVLMSGEHPFGAVYDRESNIVKGDVVGMGQLDILGEEGWEAKDLIGRMLAMDPTERPDTAECLTHPFFWTPAKRLAFLCDASDRFEIMELEPPEPTLVMLETNAQDVVGKDWYSRLDKVFTNTLGKYRKYKGGSVRDLLRAMRNKKHHYQDLEPNVKRHMGSLPSGFLHYFTSRYPTLFLHVYGVVKYSRLRHESMFEPYFQDGG